MTKKIQKALNAYIVLRIRLRELKAFLMIGRLEKAGSPGFENSLFVNNTYLNSAIFGWAFSLIDRDKSSVNLFDVWQTLFPEKSERIAKFLVEHSDATELLAHFRNNAAFHGNRSPERYVRAITRLASEFETMNAFFKDFEAIQREFLALDEQILADLERAWTALAERLGIHPEQVRERMYWLAKSSA